MKIYDIVVNQLPEEYNYINPDRISECAVELLYHICV